MKRVGGIKEKLIGAYRAGVKTVLLPAQNEKDAREVPSEVRDGLNIIYVRYESAMKICCGGLRFPFSSPRPLANETFL